jgi:hypothetical protein
METRTAVTLANAVIYKPGWRFTAREHENFEGTIVLRVDYPARNTNRDQAPDYPDEFDAAAEQPIVVADCPDDTTLYFRVLTVVLRIETHEARESLRVTPTMWAPFHPHKIDGMKRWGDVEGDLTFGIS